MTYKTNKFRIPLINIIKITNINRNFYTTNIFLNNEKEKNYDIIFSNLKILYDFQKLPYSVTFITDFYKIKIKTLKKIFPKVNHILYNFHINNNILMKLKSKIKIEYNHENGFTNNNNNNNKEEFT